METVLERYRERMRGTLSLRHGTALLIVLATAALTASALTGCTSYSSRSTRTEPTVTCDDVLGSVVQRVRIDDTSGAIDSEIQWLSDNCSRQFHIATDYFAAHFDLTSDFAYGDCSHLVGRISDEAIALVTEDGLCGGGAAVAAPQAPAQPGGGISWNEAVGYAGTVQRVCGPLAGDGVSYDDVFLNLGLDYPDHGRFQIVVWDIGGLEPIAYGSTLCTSGLITLYQGVAQIELYDPSLIEIYS